MAGLTHKGDKEPQKGKTAVKGSSTTDSPASLCQFPVADGMKAIYDLLESIEAKQRELKQAYEALKATPNNDNENQSYKTTHYKPKKEETINEYRKYKTEFDEMRKNHTIYSDRQIHDEIGEKYNVTYKTIERAVKYFSTCDEE
jgi:vacuolar-type H+-ATPase subunit I/STV1